MESLPPCPRCSAASQGELPAAGLDNKARAWRQGEPQVCRRGSFYRKHDRQRLHRFACRRCGRSFSGATGTPLFGQHKPQLNEQVADLLVSAVSQRRAAKLLKINRKTVVRKLLFGAAMARREHGAEVSQLVGSLTALQFDDLETSHHTKLKPLSISLLVDAKTRYIVAFAVASMPAKGHLARLSVDKYGPRADERPRAWHNVLSAAGMVAAPGATLTSDRHPGYPGALKKAAPSLRHRRVKSRRACVAGQGELKRGGFDPIFSLNHTAAMLRANINRLIRRTWCTTKRPDRLTAHLALYARYHNHVLLKRRPDRLSQDAL